MPSTVNSTTQGLSGLMRHSSIRDGILNSCNVVQALGTPVNSCGEYMTSLAVSRLSSEPRWEADTWWFWVQGKPGLHRESKGKWWKAMSRRKWGRWPLFPSVRFPHPQAEAEGVKQSSDAHDPIGNTAPHLFSFPLTYEVLTKRALVILWQKAIVPP